ncbi:MAG: T9SS type A sorting domain-containing protein [Bacteroidetes bacterium]|nr:T9SS type A sorting domain-containing protein [Bacteroidota bacterium]
MRTITHILMLLLIISMICVRISAQPWLQEPYLDQSRTDLNFYDIKNAFDNWAEGKDLSKEKGIKRYKRWEWFYGQRVSPTGEFPDPAVNWKEWEKQKAYSAKSLKDNAAWISIAPASVPLSLEATSIHGMGRINCIEFHPTDPNTFWIGASQGGVWKTTDDGQTWTCLTDALPVLRVSSIAVDPVNTDVIYMATGDIDYVGFPTISQGRMTQYGVGILKSTDGGATWNTTGLSFELTQGDNSLIRKIVINSNNSNELLAAGPSGIWRSSDAGETFNFVYGKKVIDVEVNPLNDSIIYVSTFYSSTSPTSKRVFKTTDFGDNWAEMSDGLPISGPVRIELAIAPSDTSVVYALSSTSTGALYAVYKTTDGGVTWIATTDDNTPNILGWADGGEFSGFDADAGQGDYDLTLAVDPLNPNRIFSGGINMWGSADGGTTWDLVTMWVKVFGPSVHADQHFSAFHPLTGHFYQTCDGGIFKTENIQIGDLNITWLIQNGCLNWPIPSDAEDIEDVIIPDCYILPTTWDDISGGLHITEYYRFASCKSNPDIIIGGSQDNGTYKYDNGTWINTYGGDGMEAMIDHYNDSIYYVTNYNGSLSKTTDGGQTFITGLDTAITSQAGELGDWVTPFVMHPTNSKSIYAGFQNIWKSEDGAMTWTKISTIGTAGSSGSQPFRALAVAASDSNYIYAARPGGLYGTSNGGQNWTSINNGLPSGHNTTYIAVHDHDPLTAWVTLSGYTDGKKVYKTTDGGTSWTNISGNLPNVSANCIVFQDSTSTCPVRGIFIGTDIGVYYTNDVLQTDTSLWIPHSNGMPNVIVNELEIQYGGGKLRAATYGRGFWETDLKTPDYNAAVPGVVAYNAGIKVFPNPNKGIFTVNAEGLKSEKIRIEVFTVTGDKVLSREETTGSGYSRNVDISNLSVGSYIVQVKAGNCHYTQKIVKQ